MTEFYFHGIAFVAGTAANVTGLLHREPFLGLAGCVVMVITAAAAAEQIVRIAS